MKIKTRQKYKNEHSSTSVTITLGVRLLGSRQNFQKILDHSLLDAKGIMEKYSSVFL